MHWRLLIIGLAVVVSVYGGFVSYYGLFDCFLLCLLGWSGDYNVLDDLV